MAAIGPIGLWALFQGVFFLLMGAIVVAVVIRWYRDDRPDRPESEQSRPGSDAGPPLESWREVYDVDNPEGDREIEDVAEQAQELSEADRKAR